MPQIVSIVGKSGSGKTTLIEKLIRELTQRGKRIGTIKHIFHEFEIDKQGKDSWRHMDAGAEAVAVVSDNKIALFKNEAVEDLNALKTYFKDMDIVLTEGFKKNTMPKIEVFRSSVHPAPLCTGDANLIAMVTDDALDADVPIYRLDDINGLADFITLRFCHTEP